MQAILSLLTAGLWGVGNFWMGVASKLQPVRLVVLMSFGIGLLGCGIYVAAMQPVWDPQAFLLGSASGLAQGVGWALLSYAMFVGRVSIVAPIAAAGTSAFIFLAGIATGDTPSFLAWFGAVTVLVAVACLTTRPVRQSVNNSVVIDRHIPISARLAPVIALMVAVCFGLQALVLDRAADHSPSLVIAGARVAVVVLLLVSLTFRPTKLSVDFSSLIPAGIAGAAILLGDIAYLSALHRGSLTIVGVLAGTNPAVTIVLAAWIMRERLTRLQLLGVVFALSGSAMLTVS